MNIRIPTHRLANVWWRTDSDDVVVATRARRSFGRHGSSAFTDACASSTSRAPRRGRVPRPAALTHTPEDEPCVPPRRPSRSRLSDGACHRMRESVEPIEIRSAAGRKQAIQFGREGHALFGFYHPPREGPWRGVGVVLCRPIGTDQTRSDRAYRHLAERLAASGFACLRFDLFGTGDSGGDERAEGLLRAWLDDVALAAAELRARSGARTIALFGLRLGATLAFVHAAERGDVDALVLWSPWVSGAKFVDEITKLHKLYLSVEPQMTAAFPSRADGEEALGLFLPRALIEDLSRIDLLRTARRPARRTLFIDGGNVAGREALMAHLGKLGGAPELQSHPGHKFLITTSDRALLPDEVI